MIFILLIVCKAPGHGKHLILPRCTVGQQGTLVANGAPGGKAAPPAGGGAGAGAGAGDGDGWVGSGNDDGWNVAGGDGDGDGASGARYVCVN